MITNRIMNHECSFMSQIVNKLLIYKLVKSIHNLTLPTPCHSQSLQEPWLCSWRGVLLLTLPGTLSSWHDDAQTLHTIPSHSWQAPGVFKLLLKVLFCSQPSHPSQVSQGSRLNSLNSTKQKKRGGYTDNRGE